MNAPWLPQCLCAPVRGVPAPIPVPAPAIRSVPDTYRGVDVPAVPATLPPGEYGYGAVPAGYSGRICTDSGSWVLTMD